ncbi:MAG TPA: phosphatidate cytidylyltransferase [Gammaproteobacteria bacterium]|nr:phosphatidate cytidylyltransferase [Gammaproteobacteria bacterium]
MLKQRILTALVLLPLAVALILYAPSHWLAAALTLVVALAAYEWAALTGYGERVARVGYAVLSLLLCAGLLMLGRTVGWQSVLWPLAVCAGLWWLVVLLWLVPKRVTLSRGAKALCGWLTLIPALFTAVAVDNQRSALLLWLFTLIWAADIGAYFAGRAFGRHKLAPEVSPGKTWEGVAGGTLALLIVAVVGGWWLGMEVWPVLLAVCLVTGWFSIVGDLGESLFKRQAGMKDSGSLFPGHGGVLDRVDSLTAAAPFFWLGLQLAGRLT